MKTARMLVILVLALGLVSEVANADFTFGTPINLGPTVNSSSDDFGTDISPDGLSHYFSSGRPGGSGGYDLWVTKRITVFDPWGQPVNLGPTVNSSAWDSCPSISADGLSLFFESKRPGGSGDDDIWVTSRPTPDGDWGPPVNLGPTVNSSAWDSCPDISADGLSLYFCSYRPGGSGSCDLWVVTRATVSDPWGQPVNLGPTVNSSTFDYGPGISADGLCLFFFSTWPEFKWTGDDDIWVTTRASTSAPWREPVNLGPTVNSSVRDFAPETSRDGCMLYFTSNRPGGGGGWDLWQVSISPVVDFNGDGIVDDADMCIMVDYWGTEEPLCDIGPMPWGDGIVDIQDMLVLTESLKEEKVDVDADAIYKEMCDLYTLAVETGDIDLYVANYTDDGVQMPPDGPNRIGSEQIRAAIEPALTQFNVECPIYPQEAKVIGNWAFGRCDWSLSLTPKEGGPTTTFDGKSTDVLKRQADGSWKFYISCWNYNGPPIVEE